MSIETRTIYKCDFHSVGQAPQTEDPVYSEWTTVISATGKTTCHACVGCANTLLRAFDYLGIRYDFQDRGSGKMAVIGILTK